MADNDEVLVGNLPMYINLGDAPDWRTHIGWATVVRDGETGRNKIEIVLDEESSQKLGNMVEVFQLKAIGFAGYRFSELDLPATRSGE
jgi:hypothetical protein